MNFFKIDAMDGDARCTTLTFNDQNRRVSLSTPAFMPVGTRASVKGLWQEDLEEIGYDLILGNTYHLYLRPGRDLIRTAGGLKKLMSFEKHAILTDSGGFQIFSLAEKMKFKENGVEFRSHIDGSLHFFSPQLVLDIQNDLRSDICMILDDCPPGDADDDRITLSLKRTHHWADLTMQHRTELIEKGTFDPVSQKVFGIVQGGIFENRRLESLQYLQSLPFDGIAVGGLSVGESREDFYRILDFLKGKMDPLRPHYLMGVGTIPDFLEAVRCGFDMFDCVLPTRNARNGQILTSEGKKNLRNAKYALSDEAPDKNCSCRVCRRYSLSYLRHLFATDEMLGPMMATFHNLHFFYNFMTEMQQSIKKGQFHQFYHHWKSVDYS